MSSRCLEGRGQQVEEMLGLDGDFVFSELLLQRIWLRGAYLRVGACTMDGRAVECLHPGRWNRRGGPDFLGARLRIGGLDTRGDVELHLRESDWAAHGHSSDPAYGGVVLHVVLFPPRQAVLTAGVGGAPLPVLALLPLLPFDLEEHALDEAAEALAGRPASEDCAALLDLAPQDCRQILETHARVRWTAKVLRAASRLQDCGWEDACHRGALEALGNSLNREPMRRVGERHPLADWRNGECEPQRVYAGQVGAWRRGGRPANHPLQRLRQYGDWVSAVPDWPARLLVLGPDLARLCHLPRDLHAKAAPLLQGTGNIPDALQGGIISRSEACALTQTESPGELWRQGRPRFFAAWRRRLVKELCCGVLAGPRFDTFVCDQCLPLLAAALPDIECDLQFCWLVWCPGDVAVSASSGLRRVFAGLLEMQVACNGVHQGFIGWGLERRRLLQH